MKYQKDNFASYRVLPKVSFAVADKVFYFGPKAPFCWDSFSMHQTIFDQPELGNAYLQI